MTDNQQPPKVFDIMRPGKALAAPTSRPVIVGHKPEVHDAMVGGETAKLGSKDQRPLLSALAKVTIQPPHQFEAPVQEPAAPPAAPTPAPAETPQPAPASVPAPRQDVPVSASFNLPAEPEGLRLGPLSDKLMADAVKEPENPNPMMQHGNQAYVSHHKHRFTLGEALFTILLIVVLTAISVNFLIDADVIKTDMNIPHTNFL